jgi:RNA-binding protein 23/39
MISLKAVKHQTSLLPTNCILLSNMFDPKEVDLTREPEYFIDLKAEVLEQCKKYGDVDAIFIEQSRYIFTF